MSNPMSTPHQARPDRDWQMVAGVVVVAAAAVILSFHALAGLGELAGWRASVPVGPVSLSMSWLLPLCVDAYGATATRVTVSARYSDHTRRHALVHAVAAVVASIAGNTTYHLIDAGALHPGENTWVLVVGVSVIPPLALGALAHLMALCAQDTATARAAEVHPGAEAVPVRPHPQASGYVRHDPVAAADVRVPRGIADTDSFQAIPGEAAPAAPPVPADVPEEVRPHLIRAIEVFGPGTRPPLRDIKKTLGCGQPRAQQVQTYLPECVAS